MNRVLSLPDAIGQVLSDYVADTVQEDVTSGQDDSEGLMLSPMAEQSIPQSIGDLCPRCGVATYVREEGCRKCHSCGHSEC